MEKSTDKPIIMFVGIINKYYPSYFHGYLAMKDVANVIDFDFREIYLKYGKDYMNGALLDIIEEDEPDLVFFWSMTEDIDLETINKIKLVSPRTKTMIYLTDDDCMYENFSMFYRLFFDYVLVCQKDRLNDYKKDGINVFFSYGTNLKNIKRKKEKKKIDVLFFGIPEFDREEYLKHLIKNKINLTLIGRGWENTSLKNYCKGTVEINELNKLMNQSKIILCFSKNKFGKPHFKARYLETMKSGSFMLMENNDTINELNVIKFNNKDDLLYKVEYYLKHEKEREELANNNYNKVKGLSFQDDLKKILKEVI